MKFTILASLFSLAAAFPAKAGQPLDVQLKKTGNTEIKAVVTNKSPKDVRVLKAGSIFDKVHTEKVKITNSNGSAIPFKGFRVSVATENLPEDAFQHIAAGDSVEVTFDVAHTHDLSEGGDFNIISEGILQYAHDTK